MTARNTGEREISVYLCMRKDSVRGWSQKLWMWILKKLAVFGKDTLREEKDRVISVSLPQAPVG